jgi:hypothetical protein
MMATRGLADAGICGGVVPRVAAVFSDGVSSVMVATVGVRLGCGREN